MIDNKIYYTILKEKEVTEENFIDLGLHAKGIADFIADDKISSWFHMAWSIKDIDYDGIHYDTSFYYCRPSYEYEEAKQKLYKNLVSEITFFTYVYSGLECYLTSLKLKECPKRKGKINAATFFIKENLNPGFSLSGYASLVTLAKKAYFYSTCNELEIKSDQFCINSNGYGLSILYKIRNHIMHGDFFFPEPLDYDSSKLPLQPTLINICSRLLLMSMQILLYASEKVTLTDVKSFSSSRFFDLNANKKYYCDEDCDPKECEGDCIFVACNKAGFLQQLHIKNSDYNVVQLHLSL